MNKKYRLGIAVVYKIACWGMACCGMAYCEYAQTQTPTQQPIPEFIQQAQTVHIPIVAYNQESLQPVKDLKASDLRLDIDGKPSAFELSRPWDRTVNPRTGQPEDRPNLLIILPLDSPQYRAAALDGAIHDLSAEPNRGWNISILDDSGDQTPYTRDMKTVIADLEKIGHTNPADTDLESWRRTAFLAIASMRILPGRRVVLTLGDIYHEMVFDGMQLVYENFDAHDVAAAARQSGAVIYASESSEEIGHIRDLFPNYYTLGLGPWMLLTRDGHLAGWISNLVSDTMRQIRQDAMDAYDIDVRLTPQQMDGLPHSVSATALRLKMIWSVPPYYMAPNLQQLQKMAEFPPKLRQALHAPPPASAGPLQLATQLEYFPHPDGRTGTQILSTGFFWTKPSPPPSQLAVALELQQTNSGYMMATTLGKLDWSAREPVWNAAVEVGPGAYMLRVGAIDGPGSVVAATAYPFTVDPAGEEPVLISSLVIGKSCVFNPRPPATPGKPQSPEYLRAGDCVIQPDPSHYYSPQDVLWTLVRITPTGKLAERPSKDWKGSFLILDVQGSRLAEQPVRWLSTQDGSYVATTAFPLDNPKLKLIDGEYAVVLTLKGPGIAPNYGEDAPFAVYGAQQAPGDAQGRKQ